MKIKKILLLGATTILMSAKMISQCQIAGTTVFSSSDACNSSTITVTGTATLKKFNNEGIYTACGGIVKVDLQKYNSTTSSWGTTGLIANTPGSYSFSITNVQGSGQYRVVMTNPNSSCSCLSTTNYTSTAKSISLNSNAHDNSYSFNGVSTFNTNCTNFNFCQGQSIVMDNILMTHPSTNTNFNQWRISTDNNQGITTWTNWTNGIPPTSYNILALLETNYGSSLPAGIYGIQLQTYNGCTIVTHYSCLTILATPNFSLDQKIDATTSNNIPSNTTCIAPYSNICPGTYGYILTAANTSIPTNQISTGQWSCSLEEVASFKGCAATPTLVFAKPYAMISNMANLNNIDLNSYATTYGGKPANYIHNSNKKWRFTLNIKYNCGNVYTYTCWLYYNTTGCRIVKSNIIEESTETLSDNAVVLFPNPTSSNVEIKTDETIKSVTVYDINGKESKIESINNSVDLSNFKSGIYTLKIYTENGISTKKIIKQD